MELIADLHLHSKYSRAVSPQMVIPEIAKWAKKKGINLVGSADWTHPLWLRELKNNLIEAGEGIYKLKSQNSNLKSNIFNNAFFLLSTEISSIYTQKGKSHRIHNLVFAPNFEVVDKINEKLRNFGVNLFSDGRPTTGLSSIELCELVFSVSKDCLVIPAHAWTPWYSLYGSNSGFDSLDECFGEFAKDIRAIETGLSSDPKMNWRIEELDSRAIISFSDAHSPKKLGREATVFEIDDITRLGYNDIASAIKEQKISYTIEFYPEEGKYHYTGHRSCGVVQPPEQTEKLGTTCPVCGRKLTVGVMHRVEQLAKRPANYQPKNRPAFRKLVPLLEILVESLNSQFSSRKVIFEYNKLTDNLGSELAILIDISLDKIAKISGEKIAEGIKKVRTGNIIVEPGYDGVFGTVKIWSEKKDVAKTEDQGQISLF